MPLFPPPGLITLPDGSRSTGGAALTARQFRPTSMVYDMPILRAKLLDVLSNASDCIIGFYGDARLAGVAAGSGGNSDWNDSARYTPPALIGRLLADSGYPVCRDGWFGVRGQGAASIPAADPQNTMTGTWVTVNASGETLGKGAQRASVSGSTWTYQPDAPWDTCDIWVQQMSGGTGACTASATGATSVAMGFSAASFQLTKYTLTKSAVDLAPLVLTAGTAFSNYNGVIAFTFRNSAKKQILIRNHAIGGAIMADHVVATRPYSSLNAYQATGLAPDVLFVEMLTNSINGSESLASWLANWDTFLAAMDTASRDMLVYIGAPCSQTWATDGTLDAWIAALKPKLDARGINLFDLRGIYGQSWAAGNALGYWYSSDALTKRGLGAYAAKVAKDLLSVVAPW